MATTAQDGPDVYRSVGGWLQLVGVLMVAFEILLVVHPDARVGDIWRRLLGRLVRWIRRVLHLPTHQTVYVSSAMGIESAVGIPEVSMRAGDWNAETPSDVRELVERHEVLLRDLDRRLEDARRQRREADDRERADRTKAEEALERQLQRRFAELEGRQTRAESRPVPIRIAGVWFFAIGIALSTWPGAAHHALNWGFGRVFALPGWLAVAALIVVLFLALQLTSGTSRTR